MSATYPLDNIRARIQSDALNPPSSTLDTLIRLLKEEGLDDLYRGIVPTLKSLCASNFVYFYVFHALKGQIKTTALQNLVIGGMAGVVNRHHNTRIKLGADYKSLWDGIFKIQREEGVKALWASVGPSLLLVLNPAIVFMTYESLKRRVKGGAATYFLIGAFAKCVATVLTYPLQIVQTKMRNGCGAKSSFALLSHMIRTQGICSIYKGLESKVIQTVTTAALMFLFYEKIIHFVFFLMRAHLKKSVKGL